jgi:hypothetical protein
MSGFSACGEKSIETRPALGNQFKTERSGISVYGANFGFMAFINRSLAAVLLKTPFRWVAPFG